MAQAGPAPQSAAAGPAAVHPAQPRPRSAPAQSRFALANWRVRWRLTAMIAVPALIAAALGGFLIYGDVNTWIAAGRVQHLAQLNASVVKLTQAEEEERDLSAGYAANRSGDAALIDSLKRAWAATDAAAEPVKAEAAGIGTGGGYQANTVQYLNAVLNSLTDLPYLRRATTSSQMTPEIVWVSYTENVLQPANTFSTAWGNGANDSELAGQVTALGSLMRAENQMSLQRAILFAALSSPSHTLAAADLTSLQRASQQESADLSDFNAATDEAEQQNYGNTVSGTAVDQADFEETLAETQASNAPGTPLTNNANLSAGSWYKNMSVTIDDTRTVADQLVGATISRANVLRSQATQSLLVTSLVTVLLVGLVVVVSAIVARSLILPLRKLRTDALDVAGHRLPEMVRRLSQSEGADEGVEIEPIGVTSTDEIGEVARAFDQVHREAVRLAADEAMLRGNLNAMFINLSRRSQSLIERQLSLIDSLEQSEQDPGRLSSLFRLDHLATRMRRNSENLLVLAGHEVTRRWSQPVPLVDVLRAAISEIEQYERVVLNVQPGIVVVGQAVNDVVHLVAEIVENATTFSPEDTQVYVSGQPLSSGGVLLDITDNGVGISDQEMSHANWRLDNPPVVDVAVSRRMGLFVVGRLAARHGVRVRLRHAQAGGLTALIWLPDTVAAPDVAPPLGRLRRFEPDDYGAAPSLSAPTATAPPNAASQATAAARIPRFTPAAPAAPAASGAPSFPGAAGPPSAASGAPSFPGAAGPAAGAPGQGAPAQETAHGAEGGTPAGNNWEPAGNGWDLGNGRDDRDHDGPPTEALPLRNGTAAGPSNGHPAGDDAEPGTSGGPSRLPSFTGVNPNVPQSPIGGQNVHGSDGPSAAVAASAANGAAAPGPDQGHDGEADDSGQVTVPPAAAGRLPIFDSLESDWFRRSGQTLATAPRPQGVQGSEPDGQESWTSPGDEGWRAARALVTPAAGETTQAGLPRRVPRANLVPGSVGGPVSQEAPAEAPARSADAVRSRMASFQRGAREGRVAAPQIEEPQDR